MAFFLQSTNHLHLRILFLFFLSLCPLYYLSNKTCRHLAPGTAAKKTLENQTVAARNSVNQCYDCTKSRKSPPTAAVNCGSSSNSSYYVCECTSCRNLGNAVDVCCQCCSCTGPGHPGSTDMVPSYHVSSVALTGDADDTLEVVFDDPGPGNAHGGHCHPHPHHHPHHHEDEIAMAHAMAESGGGLCECPPPSHHHPHHHQTHCNNKHPQCYNKNTRNHNGWSGSRPQGQQHHQRPAGGYHRRHSRGSLPPLDKGCMLPKTPSNEADPA